MIWFLIKYSTWWFCVELTFRTICLKTKLMLIKNKHSKIFKKIN